MFDLAHGRGDEVGLHELDTDVGRCEFGGEGRGPLLEEGFAAAVGCEKGSGHDSAKGCHGEDEASFSLHHARGDELCDAESPGTVDSDDVFDFFGRSLGEGDGNVVALTDVVDEDGDVEGRNE